MLIALHAHHIHVTVHSSDPGVQIATTVVYRQVLLLFVIAAAALPALNRGLRKFSTSMGSTWIETTLSQASGGGTGHERAAIPLTPLHRNKGSEASRSRNRSQIRGEGRSPNPDETDTDEQKPNFRPDAVQHNTTAAYWGKAVEPDAQSGQSQESQNSQANIIRKDVQWRVHYEAQGASS